MPLITPGAIPSLEIAGRTFTDLTNLIVLFASPKAGAGTRYGTFRRVGTSAGYQVTAGKTLKIKAMRIDCSAVSAGLYDLIKYCDNDIGLGAAADGTNPTSAVGTPITNVLATGNNQQFLCMDFAIPATKYPSFDSQAALGGLILLFGYEV